jgi:hypothetical protein
MKLVAIGQTKLKCEKKDGEVKDYKASSAVISYAKKALKKGDNLTCEFTKGEITKISKYVPKSGGTYSNNSKYTSNNNQDKMAERSAVASACTAITSVDGVTVKNVTKVLQEIIDVCLKNIRSTVSVDTVKESDTVDEFSDTDDTAEFNDTEADDVEFPEED